MILFDPIFQGLAISLMAGEVASLLLSRMAVPVLYYMRHQNVRPRRAVASGVVHSPSSDGEMSKGVVMTVERSLRLIAGGLRRRERAAGDLREPELPLVHAVRGSEPVPVGVYPVVSDDGDPAEGRIARRS